MAQVSGAPSLYKYNDDGRSVAVCILFRCAVRRMKAEEGRNSWEVVT
jgi:hypothetical protein